MTPTSATGADRRRRRARAGFTLVELMVVLVIIGLAAAAVVLTVPPLQGSVRADAERLAARASLARDEALLQGRPISLVLDRRGYGFEQRRGAEWRALREPPFAPALWSGDVRPELPRGETRQRISFDPLGAPEPAVVRLREGRTGVQIVFDGQGPRLQEPQP